MKKKHIGQSEFRPKSHSETYNIDIFFAGHWPPRLQHSSTTQNMMWKNPRLGCRRFARHELALLLAALVSGYRTWSSDSRAWSVLRAGSVLQQPCFFLGGGMVKGPSNSGELALNYNRVTLVLGTLLLPRWLGRGCSFSTARGCVISLISHTVTILPEKHGELAKR